MDGKLIFFDIDGTLLTRTGTVPESARRAISEAKRGGNLCFVNTGRPFSHIVPEVRQIPFDGYICSCGQHVILNGRTVFRTGFSPAESRAVVQLVRGCRMWPVYEAEEGVWYDWTRPELPQVRESAAHFTALGFDVTGSVDVPGFAFDKFCVWQRPESLTERFVDEISRSCAVIYREGGLLELVRRGCSKETGIRLAIEQVGGKLENCYAIGDSTNDLAMLNCVPHGIAMGNAPEEVKRRVEFVTETAEHDGIALALKRFGLIYT